MTTLKATKITMPERKGRQMKSIQISVTDMRWNAMEVRGANLSDIVHATYLKIHPRGIGTTWESLPLALALKHFILINRRTPDDTDKIQ